jgi:hypothetical protein
MCAIPYSVTVLLSPISGSIADLFGYRTHFLLFASVILLCAQLIFFFTFGQIALMVVLLLIGVAVR